MTPLASPPACLEARVRAVRNGLDVHLPAMLKHAARLTQSQEAARDLVQDSALRALAFAWSFEPGSNLRAWLHQILESVFLTQCRRRSRERRAFDALAHDPCAWPERELAPVHSGFTRCVSRALAELPPNFRDVVRLVDVEELSYRDAADALSVPLGTVMSRLHRGRRLLKTALGENDQRAHAA